MPRPEIPTVSMSLPKFLFAKQFPTDFTIHNLPYGMFLTFIVVPYT